MRRYRLRLGVAVTGDQTAARVLSVNLAHVRPNPYKSARVTGIDKRPVDGPVHVSSPDDRGEPSGSGLAGDLIGDTAAHGGDDQAVYVYAREDLDRWEQVLDRRLPGGSFGENLTTTGIDVNEALVGERWRIGENLVLQVTDPRVPCATFRGFLGLEGWLKTFTLAAVPGTYLRVVEPGEVRAGDALRVEFRPDHDVTVRQVFRAMTRERDLLPSLLAASAYLPEGTLARAREGRTFSL
jgi:MOSC domain-containing protein YiiM